MRLTTQNARKDRGGKHNDRNYNIKNSTHIDSSKSEGNKYYTYNGDTESTFEQLEKQFYEENFLSHIEKQNERNKKGGHSKRNMTLDQYYRHDFSRPEDRILQIGNIKEHASAEVLWDCALEYARQFNDRFGGHCKILDMALHVDEATPHVHIRRVWISEDKDRDLCVSQTKALHKMGFQNRNTSKWSNEKTEFTHMDRQIFYTICKDRGLKVEIDNPVKRKHLSIPEYKKAMDELDNIERLVAKNHADLREIKEEINHNIQLGDEIAKNLLQILLSHQHIANKYYMEIEEASKKKQSEQLSILTEIYKKEYKTLFSYFSYKMFIG